MKKGIIIFGPPGARKTTLSKNVANKLGFICIDIDDYIWRTDVNIPFSLLHSLRERIERLMNAIGDAEQFVMAGTMDSFHEYFDPYFVLAIHLTAPSDLRVERINQREYKKFGKRVLPGGDMYEGHIRFLNNAISYDFGGGSTSFEFHDKWANSLTCPVLRLNGQDDLAFNIEIIINTFSCL